MKDTDDSNVEKHDRRIDLCHRFWEDLYRFWIIPLVLFTQWQIYRQLENSWDLNTEETLNLMAALWNDYW